MNFYGIDYLESQTNINEYLKYVLIFGSLVLLVIVFILYLRHRIQTKYRELSIIFFLLLVFALGVQYSDYQSSQTKHSQSSQMVNFIQDISQENKISKKEIYVNSTQLTDGIIVKMDGKYYKVSLSADQSSYTLTKAHLLNTNIVIND